MTDTEIEFLKIILDKGLLALILLGVGFYLNRAIEKYKSELNKGVEKYRAQNTYNQKIVEHRIQAYQETSEAFGMHMHSILRVINMTTPTLRIIERSSNSDDEVRGLLDTYREYCATETDHKRVIQKNIAFLSASVGEMIVEYQKHVLAFHEIFRLIEKSDYSSEGWQKYGEHKATLQGIQEALMARLTSVQHTMSEEIYSNPFG